MYEHFRNDMMVALANKENISAAEVLALLDSTSTKYDFHQKTLELAIPTTEGLPELVKLYLVCKKMIGLSPATLENSYILLRLFFQDVRKAPGAVTTNDIRVWLWSYQKAKKVSSRTLDSYRQDIARFFAWAHDEGYIKENPAKRVEAIKYETIPRSALSYDELEEIRGGCRTLRDLAIVEVLYSTGCRVSELAGLKKSDINWRDLSVHLFGKGRKHRTSWLNERAAEALCDYLNSREDDCEMVFVSARRPFRPVNKDSLEDCMRTISKRVYGPLGKRVTPHILRHTTATIALNNGMPIEDISKLLGHESIDTTMIYAEADLSRVREGHHKYIV